MTSLESTLVFPFIFLLLILMMGIFVDVTYEASLFMAYDTQVATALYEPERVVSEQVKQSNFLIAKRASVDIEGTLTTRIHALFDKTGKDIVLQASDMRFDHRFILTSERRLEDIIDEIK